MGIITIIKGEKIPRSILDYLAENGIPVEAAIRILEPGTAEAQELIRRRNKIEQYLAPQHEENLKALAQPKPCCGQPVGDHIGNKCPKKGKRR